MAAFVSAAYGQAGPPGPMQSGTHVGADGQSFDVNKLFASSCGWCHSKGGREAGKGPMLMGTELTDAQIVSRIRTGKAGQMPAFGFTDDQLGAIVAYIRALKRE
jgi:cytochrome c553